MLYMPARLRSRWRSVRHPSVTPAGILVEGNRARSARCSENVFAWLRAPDAKTFMPMGNGAYQGVIVLLGQKVEYATAHSIMQRVFELRGEFGWTMIGTRELELHDIQWAFCEVRKLLAAHGWTPRRAVACSKAGGGEAGEEARAVGAVEDALAVRPKPPRVRKRPASAMDWSVTIPTGLAHNMAPLRDPGSWRCRTCKRSVSSKQAKSTRDITKRQLE